MQNRESIHSEGKLMINISSGLTSWIAAAWQQVGAFLTNLQTCINGESPAGLIQRGFHEKAT